MASAVAIAWAASAADARGEPTSTIVASPALTRWRHTATLLLDGRVLVAGGPFEAAMSGEIFDPRTGQWERTANDMASIHAQHLAVRLHSGKVLVLGGYSKERTAELYDPVTDSWTTAAKMKWGHTDGTATALPDGRVLVCGGYDAGNRCEIYTPDAPAPEGSWQTASALPGWREDHTATLLPGGQQVLLVGGGVLNNGVWTTFGTTFLYDIARGTWSAGQKLSSARRGHRAISMADGRVVFAGGFAGESKNPPASPDVVIYDPALDQWSEDAPDLRVSRRDHQGVVLVNGAVMISGGRDSTHSSLRSNELLFEGTWTVTTGMEKNRFYHTATVISGAGVEEGSVLIVGGQNEASAEMFRLDDNGAACAGGGTCKSGFCVEGVCCESACDSCRSCAVPGFEGACISRCADDTHVDSCPVGDCAPYRCIQTDGASDARCGDDCASVDDCAPGFACNLEGRCVPPPGTAFGDTGSCSVVGSGGATPWLALAPLGLAIALRRRRRQTIARLPGAGKRLPSSFAGRTGRVGAGTGS